MRSKLVPLTQESLKPAARRAAYFTMEIALLPGMATYSGGLGVLAGDTIRSFADLEVPMVAVTLLYRKGYFYQRLDKSGWQTEEAVEWAPESFAHRLPNLISVKIEGRDVQVGVWRFDNRGVSGAVVPVYLLDTDLPENDPEDRRLTDHLYGGESTHRLKQEILLGIAGVRMLRSLGHTGLRKFHMNEGHAALLTLELLSEVGAGNVDNAALEEIRRRCVFTTHTPVAAGHDQFDLGLVERVISPDAFQIITQSLGFSGVLNMTHLALKLSNYVNGVARKHGEVSQKMFPGHPIWSITNGVHARTWVADQFATLFDEHLQGWREDTFTLRNALRLPEAEVVRAHQEAKRALLQLVDRTVNAGMKLETLTLGFARRSTAYKRPDLMFHNIERLAKIAENVGPLQIIFAGKAHPHDTTGKQIIQRIFEARRELKGKINVAFIQNYDMAIGKLITAGCDVWVNNPERPLEASGTSGMKAAMNGVPSLSILDGWWIEGCVEGVTGWAIGDEDSPPDRDKDAESLYTKLEQQVIPTYYADDDRWTHIMRNCIALNGSYFHTQRMALEYLNEAYFD